MEVKKTKHVGNIRVHVKNLFQIPNLLFLIIVFIYLLREAATLAWPQMIQFWDVDLSAINQSLPVNLPPKLK